MKKILTSLFFVLGIALALPVSVADAQLSWTAVGPVAWWRQVASSADGVKLVALSNTPNGYVYTSTDSGLNWVSRFALPPGTSPTGLASSADGTRLALTTNYGRIYTSTDSGISWTARDSNRFWYSIASSADGTKLAAVEGQGGARIYTSSDSGVTWIPRGPSKYWFSIASSADGTKLFATTNSQAYPDYIYVSTDSGITWTARASVRPWSQVTSSADGTKVAALADSGQIYVSSDSGLTWTARATALQWVGVTSSADGARLTAVTMNQGVYSSSDSGATWTLACGYPSCLAGTDITSSANGRKLVSMSEGTSGRLQIATDLTGLGTGHNMRGYAWSSTIGWVSFSCNNDASCVSSDYGVNFDPSNSTLSGYAWSSSVGWVQFGGLSGFPSGSGTFAENAKISGGSLRGWAKAISAEDAGWDGWISLKGTGYGITQSGTALAGYAWGSSVVGWLGFDTASTTGFGPGVTITGVVPPSVALDARVGGSSVNGSTSVAGNSTVSLVATLANLPVGTTCSISKTSSGGTALSPSPSASSSVSWTVTAAALSGPINYAYALTCDNNAGYSNTTQAVSFSTLLAQPEFSIGGSEEIGVQFIRSGNTDSQIKTITVYPTNFTGNVNVSLVGISPAMHASTTVLYSIGGGAFSANPPSVSVASNGATTFRIRLSQPIQNICSTLASNNPVGCVDYYITLNATDASGQGAPQKSKVYRINQAPVGAKFKEI